MSNNHESVRRVAHVAEALGGGLLEVVRLVCDGNHRAGMQVLLLHGRRPETPEGPLSLLMPNYVEVIEIPRWGSRSPIAELRAARILKRELIAHKIDVVVFHSSFAGVTGAIAKVNCPTIFTPHAFASQIPSSVIRQMLFKLGERYACRVHKTTVCVSHSEGQIASSLGASNVMTIPNGIPALDTPQWGSEPNPPSDAKVVGIGRLVPQRRPIETAAVLRGVNDLAHVEWIGGGGSPRYAKLASQSLAADGVRLTGWLPQASVTQRLSEASIYVHWTSWDGLPMTVLEAIAHDVVVVASDTAPNREVLGQEGVCATEQEAITMIRNLLSDSALWRERIFAQRARAKIYGSLSMQASWNQLLISTGASDITSLGAEN